MYVCFSKEREPNNIVESSEYQNKTIQQIITSLKLKNEYIAYQSPYYRQKLGAKANPLSEFPDITLSVRSYKYPPPPYNLLILKDNEPSYSIKMQIKTQLDPEFPLLEVEFTDEQLKSWKGADLLKECIKLFKFNCTDAQILNQESVVIKESDKMENLFEYSKKNHLVFKCVIDDSDALKRINTRCCLAAEVLSSEEAFMSDIFQIVNYWKPAFEKSGIFDTIQLRFMFRDMLPILKTHSEFLKELKKIKIDYSSEFGPIFMNFVERFKVSLSFITKFKGIDEMIKKKRYSTKMTEAKFAEIEEGNTAANGRDFLSYYITPVQRYPRYPLLIRDLDKNTPPFHPDKKYLSLSLSLLDNANKDIDQTSHRVKNLIIMEAIQKSLPETFFLMEEKRELIIEKSVNISKPRIGSCILYLFSDIVLVVVKGKKMNTPFHQEKIEYFKFCNCRPSNDSILIFINKKEHVISFEDCSERQVWMEAFNQVRTKKLSDISCQENFVKWTDVELGEKINPLMNHDGCFYNGKVYIICGSNSSPVSMMVEYDVNENTWSSSKIPINARNGHTVTVMDDKIYVLFGNSKSHYYPHLEKYDITTGEWSQIRLSMKCKRTGHTTVAYNNQLIVFGGKSDKDTYLNDILFIDVSTGTVEKIANLPNSPIPRTNHTSTLIDDAMIVIGGKIDGSISNEVFCFNVNARVWTLLTDVKTTPRYCHRTAFLDQNLFVVGGISFNNEHLSTDAFDAMTFENVSFTNFGNMPPGISRFALVPIGTYCALVYGGTDAYSKVPFASSWILDVEEGFSDDRKYNPEKDITKKKPEIKRMIVTLPDLVEQPAANSETSSSSKNAVNANSNINNNLSGGGSSVNLMKDGASSGAPPPPPPPPPPPAEKPPQTKVETRTTPVGQFSPQKVIVHSTSNDTLQQQKNALPSGSGANSGPITQDTLAEIREKMKRKSMSFIKVEKETTNATQPQKAIKDKVSPQKVSSPKVSPQIETPQKVTPQKKEEQQKELLNNNKVIQQSIAAKAAAITATKTAAVTTVTAVKTKTTPILQRQTAAVLENRPKTIFVGESNKKSFLGEHNITSSKKDLGGQSEDDYFETRRINNGNNLVKPTGDFATDRANALKSSDDGYPMWAVGQFEPALFYPGNNINVTNLNPIELQRITFKAKNVFQKVHENNEMEKRIKRLSENKGAHDQIVLKIVIKNAKTPVKAPANAAKKAQVETRACRISAKANIMEVSQKVEMITKKKVQLSIEVGVGNHKQLNEKSLEDAKKLLAKNRCIKIIVD